MDRIDEVTYSSLWLAQGDSVVGILCGAHLDHIAGTELDCPRHVLDVRADTTGDTMSALSSDC